ncbi:MAG: 2-oxoacid:acceptor oxidoreductase family protein [Gemmatimonadetes bacterium]|nr:2-oxoacid:acceptor oxidoreductase family protein [Gemmatimonadota bacterium]
MTTITPLVTFRNETPYPFCPGCGHGPILDHLNAALVKLQLDPRQVVIVSDIGCSGLSDQYFATSAFHGLHGRSITYATGIKLARPGLTVIVVMGDGGTGIGGAHLLNAARRNIGITVLVCNNMNFGMTGGQHSTTTPAGAFTATTPSGNLERPLDVCATVAVNGAGFVYRGTSFDPDLADRMTDGIRHPGFALLDIWEPCTAYFAPRNRLTKKALFETLEAMRFPTGILQQTEVPEYAEAYRAAHADELDGPTLRPRPIQPRFRSALERRFSMVLAGSAGGRVGSAARLLARAGVLSGLYAALRNDYPVTVRTGHSTSELVLSPVPIDYAGVTRPEVLVVLSTDGAKQSRKFLKQMRAEDQVVTLPEFADLETPAPVSVLDFAATGGRLRASQYALAVASAAAARLSLFPAEALLEAVRQGEPEHLDSDMRAVEAGRGAAHRISS